eukprot:754055_1
METGGSPASMHALKPLMIYLFLFFCSTFCLDNTTSFATTNKTNNVSDTHSISIVSTVGVRSHAFEWLQISNQSGRNPRTQRNQMDHTHKHDLYCVTTDPRRSQWDAVIKIWSTDFIPLISNHSNVAFFECSKSHPNKIDSWYRLISREALHAVKRDALQEPDETSHLVIIIDSEMSEMSDYAPPENTQEQYLNPSHYLAITIDDYLFWTSFATLSVILMVMHTKTFRTTNHRRSFYYGHTSPCKVIVFQMLMY